MNQNLIEMGKAAQKASRRLCLAATEQKNQFLLKLSDLLLQETPAILAENRKEVAAATGVLTEAMVDRLMLDEKGLPGLPAMCATLPAWQTRWGEIFEESLHPNSLKIHKARVPMGVVAVIYESRPNVTVDTACLMIKSGNAAILRGGKETLATNMAFMKLIRMALEEGAGLPADSISFIDSSDRNLVMDLLHMDQYIDLVIPRGGAGLHDFCRKNSRIPVITGGIGVCHMFVDASADLIKALPVIRNAKVQRPTVCNALETLLVHQEIAEALLPEVCRQLAKENVQFRTDRASFEILTRLGDSSVHFEMAGDGDFDKEWLSLVLGIKVVQDVAEAIDHIRDHGTGHSDSILTETELNAQQFASQVNSSCVYVNASTRFTDGSELGLGAEIAISTQPLHARGRWRCAS